VHLCACGNVRLVAREGSIVLRRRDRLYNAAEFVDPEFAEALTGNNTDRQSADRKALRKTRQLCRQVQCALNYALADIGPEGMDLFVEEVVPAPDCGHLAAYVAITDGSSVVDALSALRSLTPQLRSEVAMAIARKRAPELVFVPAVFAGGEDE